MKRLIITTKWCSQLMSNNTYFPDRWFIGVKTDEEAMSEVVDYCGPVNMIHRGFCLSTL